MEPPKDSPSSAYEILEYGTTKAKKPSELPTEPWLRSLLVLFSHVPTVNGNWTVSVDPNKAGGHVRWLTALELHAMAIEPQTEPVAVVAEYMD